MSVYHDGGHLVADSLDELHRFARKIGLKRAWFQGPPAHRPHYDLMGGMARKATDHGAQLVSSRILVEVAARCAAPGTIVG